MQGFELEEYLSKGVERTVKKILKMAVHYPQQSVFMVRYAGASKRMQSLRIQEEKKGEHIPPFLIASITDQCNLSCEGCYARANEACNDGCSQKQMTRVQWGNIFGQAAELGIGFILLAGGEPFARCEILEEAGKYSDILFPVFTNGTMMNETNLHLLATCRNLVPVLSIEGGRESTDARRGQGVYDTLLTAMEKLKSRGILFGASVTVTKKNIKEVYSDQFAGQLQNSGCKAVVFVEYVPADKKTACFAPDEMDRLYMEERIHCLRVKLEDMLLLSFPGDEKSSGGCLAAGRGFFHINARGGAEPCPFSQYSDTSLIHTPLRDALRSPLFLRLKDGGLLTAEHTGGCVLFEQEEQVKKLAAKEN